MAGEVRQRYMQANYIAVGATDSTYVLMGAGFSELNESPSAQTSSKRYINDKALTKRVSGYDWSSPFTTDQLQKIGADAETDYVIVDLDQKETGDTSTSYHARKFHVAIEISSFDNNDGEMAASGNLLQIGDLVEGTFDTSTKTFTPKA